jgi:hypothetical protein
MGACLRIPSSRSYYRRIGRGVTRVVRVSTSILTPPHTFIWHSRMKVDNDILGDGRENPNMKGIKATIKRWGRKKRKRKREDSKEDKLQPRNTVSLMDFQST